MANAWPGIYSDSRGREAISIQAAGTGLSVEIRGVTFTGADFDALEPPADLAVAGHSPPITAC